MRVTIIWDATHTTVLSTELKNALSEKFRHDVLVDYGIKKEDFAHCLGCFGCWVKSPGMCQIPDLNSQINKSYMNSELVVFLSPVIFGGLSANIKNVLDRTLPNVSPFFTTRNGVTTHKKRYRHYPKLIFIGYGDAIGKDQQALFCEWLTIHSISSKNFICSTSQDVRPILLEIENLTKEAAQ